MAHLTPQAICPIDFKYVRELRWDAEVCRGGDTLSCCTMIFGLFGIAFAQYLKQTANFYFPNTSLATSCLSDFQVAISPFLPSDLILDCFKSPSNLVSNPLLCAGVQTLSQWKSLLPTATLDHSYCKGDLLDLSSCNLCVAAMQKHTQSLAAFTNSTSNCFYFSAIYVTGIVNEYGPGNPNTVQCSLGLPLLPISHRNIKISEIAIGVGVAVSVLLGVVCVYFKCFHRRFTQQNVLGRSDSVRPNLGPLWLDYKVIKTATDNFSETNLVGRGGFGVVYKGNLPDGRSVAVKRLLDSAAETEFKNEMDVISAIRHRHLVALRGCCVTVDADLGPQRFLVYDYYPNGNLEGYLFGQRASLTWEQRRNIITCTAQGLAYLHASVNPPIYHRDIKPTNVLLDRHMNALVADFGLARFVNKDAMTSTVAGTYGYIAPEYALYGQLTEKSDVYSFGVLVLVTLSGRRALLHSDSEGDFLVTDWAWRLVKSQRGIEVLDGRIRQGAPESVVVRFVKVGILCAHVMVAFRPSMNEALKMLHGDIEIPNIPDRSLPMSMNIMYITSASESLPKS